MEKRKKGEQEDVHKNIKIYPSRISIPLSLWRYPPLSSLKYTPPAGWPPEIFRLHPAAFRAPASDFEMAHNFNLDYEE